MGRLSGVLPVDKPSGPTSHDVVLAVRRATGVHRVGHAGTLDPLATGVLLLCLGSATRISEFLAGHDKVYSVEARLGVATDTYDAEGQVVAEHDGPMPADRQIEEAVRSLEGDILQTPPPYSAVKVRGRPLYEYARTGSAVRAEPREVSLYSIGWSRPSPYALRLQVHCSAGTYVRSLVHDLGQRLGCGAHVTGLRRLRSGPFEVGDCLELEEAMGRLRCRDRSVLVDIAAALGDFPRLALGEADLARLMHGQAVAASPPREVGFHVVTDPEGTAVGIARWDAEKGLWRPRKVFPGEVAVE